MELKGTKWGDDMPSFNDMQQLKLLKAPHAQDHNVFKVELKCLVLPDECLTLIGQWFGGKDVYN